MVPGAIGSQTKGSTIRPAAYCGVVGFKGTRGAVPMTGSFPLARTLDHIGIFARTIADTRLVSDVLTGHPVERRVAQPPRIALVPALIDRTDRDVATQIGAAADRLARAGAEVSEIVLPPSFGAIHDVGRTILEGEFATYQEALYRAHADRYRPRTRGLIDAGLAQKTTDYVKAQQARTRFKDDMVPVFGASPILLTPVASGTAPKGLNFTGDPWFCTPWSTIGVPALSMPIAVGAEGLPHAIQLVAADGADADLLDAAAWCEAVIGFASAPGEPERVICARSWDADSLGRRATGSELVLCRGPATGRKSPLETLPGVPKSSAAARHHRPAPLSRHVAPRRT
jgi:Asp-tRNA(Asn)/Glu-tRNA(Gln) amidotransferase A subunit family amidase